MNLFLLTAVPAATFLIVWHYLVSVPKSGLFLNSVAAFAWSIGILIVTLPFGGLAVYDGNLLTGFLGYWFVDGFLIPGGLLAIFAWRHGRESDQGKTLLKLTLWLGALFTIECFRDFFATSPHFDLNELFFLPLSRILLITWLPVLFLNFWVSRKTSDKILWASAAIGLGIGSSIVQILSFSHWGWTVWILLSASFVGSWFYLNRFYRV